MKIIVIIGPTGVGKTKLSISLAKKLDAYILNGDSMQVYKSLDIGTAKIKENEKMGVKHFLFDIVEPTEDFNIYEYQKLGRELLDKFIKENRNVIIVGGSGLYIKSLLYDYRFQEEEKLNDYDDLTNEEILEKIKKVHDTNIHVNNRKRLVRELNKIENNNNIKSDIFKKMYDFDVIGLTTERDLLYKIVDDRVDMMVQDGLVAEVKKLYDKNIRSKSIMTGIGYKELYDYFDKKVSYEEAINNIKKNTRHFIKRQYTFFNRQMDVNWIKVNFTNFNETVQDALQILKIN